MLKTLREKWMEILLLISLGLNFLAFLAGDFKDKIPDWVGYAVVASVAIYYTYKYFQKNPYPPNVQGAKRAVKEYLTDVEYGIGPSAADFRFWNTEVQEVSPTDFLVGVNRRDSRKIALMYRAGRGITMDRKRGLDKIFHQIETSEFTRQALESQNTLNNPFVKDLLKRYGLNKEDEYEEP